MFLILRGSLLLFSLYGYSSFFKDKLKFDEKISWIASSSFVTLVLYVSAYINQLVVTGIGLFIIGLIFASIYVYQRIKKRQIFELIEINGIVLWMLFFTILFGVTLFQSQLVHYDNYSHWALIVKYLFTEGSLPTAQDTIISFSSYPMGSSLFIYYVVLIVGFQENVMLLGQFLLIVFSVYAMFSVLHDIKSHLSMSIMFVFISIFNYFNIAIRMNNLLVDFLLPIITLAGLAGIFRMQKNLMVVSLYTFLIAGMLSIIKNSAAFFVAVLVIYYFSRLFVLWREKKNGKGISLLFIGFLTAVASYAPYLIWSKYVQRTFTESKHEVNLSAYQQIFNDKDTTILNQITELFFNTILDFRTISTQGILLVNLIMLIGFIILRYGLKYKNNFLKELLLIDSIIISYYIGIYLMFLFSMPTEEALYLAGFDRYASSIVILALGLSSFFVARAIEFSSYRRRFADQEMKQYQQFKSIKTKKFYQYSILFMLFFSTLLLLSENNGMLYNNKYYSESIPAAFKRAEADQLELNQERYLVVSSDKEAVDSYLIGYVGKYYLYSPIADGYENFIMDDDEFLELLSSYDKVVILEEHYTFNVMTKKLFNHTYPIGVYSVEEILANK